LNSKCDDVGIGLGENGEVYDSCVGFSFALAF